MTLSNSGHSIREMLQSEGTIAVKLQSRVCFSLNDNFYSEKRSRNFFLNFLKEKKI